ncbi:hypothetical protein CSX04_04459 [Burkholderia cepacia]|nr:hypothetical protein CSX04_04459 [Burkholderia cepacia]
MEQDRENRGRGRHPDQVPDEQERQPEQQRTRVASEPPVYIPTNGNAASNSFSFMSASSGRRACASEHQNFWRMPTTATTCDVVVDALSVPSIHAWPTPDDAFW